MRNLLRDRETAKTHMEESMWIRFDSERTFRAVIAFSSKYYITEMYIIARQLTENIYYIK